MSPLSSSPPLPVCLCRRRLFRTVACVIVLCLGTTPLCAQLAKIEPNELGSEQSVSKQRQGPWVPRLSTVGQDVLDVVQAPVMLSPSERLLTLGASGVVFSTVAALDQPVYENLNGRSGWAAEATGPLAGPGRWFDQVGPDRMAYSTAGLLAVSGVALGRRDLTRTSVRVIEALVLTKAVTGFAKGLFNRSRPFAGHGPLTADIGEFEGEHTKLSMPSGHTARAFALASVLSHQADRWYVSTLAYGGAASVGLERVRSGDHWLTDVIVGGTLGYLIGRSVVPSDSPSIRGVNYSPILSPNRIGLSIQF